MTVGTAQNPEKTATYRAMMAVVIILGVLIVLALGALIAGGAMKLAGHKGGAPASFFAELPQGARITGFQTSGNRVIVGLRTPQGDELDIFDTDTGRPVARIRPAPPDVPK